MCENESLGCAQSWKYPEHFLDSLLENPWYRMVYKVLGQTCISANKFFVSEGAQPALMPLTTGSISSPMGLGSDSLPVAIQMNGEKTYLADSMQFYLELAVRMGGAPAFYIMPSFRDEEADERHLNQFFHAETEIVGDLSAVQSLAERLILYLSRDLLRTSAADIVSVAGTVSHIEALVARGFGFPQVTFEEAVTRLENTDGALKTCETGDPIITSKGETHLISEYGDFLWLTHFPVSTVPFYQARDPQNPRHSLSADLLAGIGEVLGSGARARTGGDVLDNLHAARVDPKNYDWYVRMKQAEPVQTAGFGLGIERFLMWVTRTRDIRDWSLVPRDRHGKGPL